MIEGKAEDGCLRVAALTWPPFIELLSATPPYQFTGIMLKVMDIIARHLHFCYRVKVPAGMDWGRQLGNGTFTGMLGEFERQEWDMSIVPVGVSHTRYQVMDFSSMLYMDDTTVLYTRPTPEADVTGFIKPYTPVLWALLLLSTVVVTGITFLVQLNLHTDRLQSTAMETTEGRRRRRTRTKALMLRRAIQWVVCCLLAQAVSWEPRRTVVRLVAGVWLMMSLIVASVYRSNLKAMLILPKTSLPFHTVSELATTDITTTVIKGSLIDHAIKAASPDSPLGRMRDQITVLNNVIAGVSIILKGEAAGFSSRLAAATVAASAFSMNGYCSIYLITEGFLGTSTTLGFLKGSPLIPKVNRIISSLREAGVLQHMYKDTLGDALTCLEPVTATTTVDVQLRSLELQDFFGVFSVYGGGMLVALVTFLLEILVFSVSRKKKI